jgi:flagellar protein FlgJ
MNDFTNTLYDQNADPIQKRTAQTMIDNYKDKAGEIAFYQEAMKGFPQGIPAVAANYAEGVMGAPMAAYGGYIPKAQKGGQSTADKKASFVQQYGPIAQKVGAQFGIDPSIILAQAAQESGWGTSSLFKRSNNLFGVMAFGKPNDYWAGSKTEGKAGNFRVYPSAENSMADFARLIRDKYKSAYKVANDPEAYAKAIANSPYISETNGDNREIYERNVRNNALEIQRLLPEAIQAPAPSQRQAPTETQVPVQSPGFVSGLDNDVMDIYLQIDPAQRAARRDMGQTQFFRPSQSAERFIPQTGLQMPVDVVNNPNNINYAIQSDVDLSMINPYTGGRTEAGRITPTGIENRFERSLPDYIDSWKGFIPGIANMSNKQAQSAIYDYLVENEPDAVRNMWGTYGLTAKGKQNKSLSGKYDKGTIDPKNLSEEDLKGLKDAYVDGLFGVRQMDPVNYGFSETPVNVPLRDSGRYTPQPGQIQRSSQIPPISEEEETEISDSTQATQAKTVEDRLRPWLQDVNNLDTARRNMLSERRYFPYAPKIPNALADAVYLDDTRQQQQIAGRSRGVIEALGAFSGPSRQASMASVISGQAGDQAANVAATMGNANAQIANQLEQFNSQMQLRGNMLNAELAKNLFDETTTTLDTYDEKMRRYRSLNTLLENNLLTNAYRTKAMNKMNPLFQIDPSVGGDFEFMPGVSAAMFDPNNFVGQSQRFDAAYNSAAERIKTSGHSPEIQTELLKKLEEKRIDAMFGSSSKNSAPAYDPTGYYTHLEGSNMRGIS